MKIIQFLTYTAVAPALLLLSSCATKPPAMTTLEITDAAETIVKEAVYYSTLFNTCASLGGDQEITAIDKQQDWINANAALVAAADVKYSEKIAASTLNYDGQSLSPIAVYLAQQARQRALNELNLKKRTVNNQRKTCDFRLGQITSANINLTSQPAIAAAYADIIKSAPASNIDMQSVPKLAAGIDLSIPPGRTYYTVNKALEKECDEPFTLTIANNWPNEVYANFCANNLIDTLICEWGKCEAKKL